VLFAVKYFMTVGDWTARIWMEDLKSPLMTTKYDKSYLTSGCWSPTRPGVLFTTKLDGTLDVWDYNFKQNDPTFSTKVSDSGLASIKVQNAGRMVALGSMDGTVTVLQLSRGLYEPQKDEKANMSQMFERELRREKNLELRYIQRKRDEKEREKKAKEEEKKNAALAMANGGIGGVGGAGAGGAGAAGNGSQANGANAVDAEDDAETREAIQKADIDFYLAIDRADGGGANGQQHQAGTGAGSSMLDPQDELDGKNDANDEM
jgi:WD40 repeat protein